jgi:ribulose-5-phosphate 4-epimerase/fuculose-1-phosphate aldolase
VLSSLGHHDNGGVALRDDEKPRLVADLGARNFLMLRNLGLLTVGQSVPDAFLSMCLFETVCTIQVRAMAGGTELVTVDPRIIDTAQQQAAAVTKGLGSSLTWPGLLRRLERRNPGHDG